MYLCGLHEPAATHAWADVWDVERGWITLDSTHGRDQTDAYVRVAVGRDYADVPPTRGVLKGSAQETLAVRVPTGSLGLLVVPAELLAHGGEESVGEVVQPA